MAVPTIACSEIGVSSTRCGPNRSNRPSVTLNAPPAAPMSSPSTTTPVVASQRVGQSLAHGLAVA